MQIRSINDHSSMNAVGTHHMWCVRPIKYNSLMIDQRKVILRNQSPIISALAPYLIFIDTLYRVVLFTILELVAESFRCLSLISSKRVHLFVRRTSTKQYRQ